MQLPLAGIPVAEYVRASKEKQLYSIEHQRKAINAYATELGLTIVASYEDFGRSGLNVTGRPSLQALLRDIESGSCTFRGVIVYDVSRWGRFQDVDEAAYIELRCKRMGVPVHYCAEHFSNDGSMISTIIKNLKRVMAAEYSRELSQKVFVGQASLIKKGYRQGGRPGLGFRRMLVDQYGLEKGLLNAGEQKSISTDRVVLVRGPESEVSLVNEIFTRFADQSQSEREICHHLNSSGFHHDSGAVWTKDKVQQLLTNEKYIGESIWGKTSFKLKGVRKQIHPEHWTRALTSAGPIVNPETFWRARRILELRKKRLDPHEMISVLKRILLENGIISAKLIDNDPCAPSVSSYRLYFGDLPSAYRLAGFETRYKNFCKERSRRLYDKRWRAADQFLSGLQRLGVDFIVARKTGLVTFANGMTAKFSVMTENRSRALPRRWTLNFRNSQGSDLIIGTAQVDREECDVEFYLFVRAQFTRKSWSFTEACRDRVSSRRVSPENFIENVMRMARF